MQKKNYLNKLIKENNKNKIQVLVDEIECKNKIIKQLKETISNYKKQLKINAKELR